MTRPGAQLRGLLARHCSDKTMWQNIDPVIADLQAEYAAARKAGRPWRSRWIRICGYGSICKVVAMGDWRPEDLSQLGRTIRISGLTTLAVAAVLVWPEFLKYSEVASVAVSAYLVPFALTLAIPTGLLMGVLWAARDDRPSLRTFAAVMTLAAAAATAMFINLNWLTPAANQAFRTEIFAITAGPGMVGEIPKGPNEMDLTELRERYRALPDDGSRRRTITALTYYRRWALPFAPLPLALFALSVRVRRGIRRLIIPIGAAVAFWVCVKLGGELSLGGLLPSIAGAWFANAAVSAAAVRNLARRREPVGA